MTVTGNSRHKHDGQNKRGRMATHATKNESTADMRRQTRRHSRSSSPPQHSRDGPPGLVVVVVTPISSQCPTGLGGDWRKALRKGRDIVVWGGWGVWGNENWRATCRVTTMNSIQRAHPARFIRPVLLYGIVRVLIAMWLLGVHLSSCAATKNWVCRGINCFWGVAGNVGCAKDPSGPCCGCSGDPSSRNDGLSAVDEPTTQNQHSRGRLQLHETCDVWVHTLPRLNSISQFRRNSTKKWVFCSSWGYSIIRQTCENAFSVIRFTTN